MRSNQIIKRDVENEVRSSPFTGAIGAEPFHPAYLM